MKSLTQAAKDYERIIRDRSYGVHSVAALEARSDVLWAAARNIDDSHITRTFPDGSSGEIKVTWNAEEQRFVDPSDDFWLYGPASHRGEQAGGRWVLAARHDHEVIVKAILDRAKIASRLYQEQKVWRFYWQLLLVNALRDSDPDVIYDLHLQPLNVDTLASKPVVKRLEDITQS